MSDFFLTIKEKEMPLNFGKSICQNRRSCLASLSRVKGACLKWLEASKLFVCFSNLLTEAVAPRMAACYKRPVTCCIILIEALSGTSNKELTCLNKSCFFLF